jgi:hypothetical protein
MAVAAAMSYDRGWDHVRQATTGELAAVLEGGPHSAACAELSRAANIDQLWAYGATASEAFKRGITITVPVPRKGQTS